MSRDETTGDDGAGTAGGETTPGMKLLILGAGAREHALAWKLARSPEVREILCAPGNGGTAREVKCSNVVLPRREGRADHDHGSLAAFARNAGVDLVVVGPEAPLVAGVADTLREADIPVVGPGREAARLEGSKAFAKEFMRRNQVPTARSVTAYTPDEAYAAIEELGAPLVVKADGLAAGKGVTVAQTPAEARRAVEEAMVGRRFGEAGSIVVLEELLEGFEASVILLTDGSAYVTFPAAQDHKRIGEGDSGPNTGGMGAVAPHPRITPALSAEIDRLIVQPTIAGMRREKWDYRGFLFIGLMIGDDGPKVLEYNVRMGDPEAQALLPLLDGDLAQLLRAVYEGRLESRAEDHFRLREESACAVVAAAEGYPGDYKKGLPVSGLDDLDTPVFIAGAETADGGDIYTTGGRVLTVTGMGPDLAAAQEAAYLAAASISFPGMYLRRDIGGRLPAS
jgi:phosphoribosylamine--glycine ligase